MRLRSVSTSFLLLLVSLSFAPLLAAEPLRAHGSLGAGHAISGYQKDEYAWGTGASLALEYPFVRQLGLELSVSWLGLSQGDPTPKKFEPVTGASAISPELGLRMIPFAADHNGHLLSPAGLWAKLAGGVAFTNGLSRPTFDAGLGWDLLNASGRVGAGPMMSFVHVFQPDDEFRPDDANVLLFGVHGLFDFGSAPPVKGDRDHDGILDDVDRCPDTPEDKDGLLDRVDKCPNEPEDNDGWDSLDGCPDPDNDADGILDVKDLCPFEPETVNGYADNDGCPDEEQVRVVGDKIVLDDRVHFFVNSAVIRQVSYPLLNRLTKLVAEHPEYTHISVEGHADERGAEDFNRKLSDDRARSVLEFMVKQGVARDRLSSPGFGSSRPLVDSKNEYAWLLNRRVEFTVTRQTRQGGSATSTTGVNVPTENNVQKAVPVPGPADVPPPADAKPPRKSGDNEPESATPPPEAGHPGSGPKAGGAAK